jgi:hypothetical protein
MQAATPAPASAAPVSTKKSEVDERIERITEHKGVKGLLIVNFREDKDGG